MNECSTEESKMYTSCASLVALGVKLHEMKLFELIRQCMQIARKTVKDRLIDKVYYGWIAILVGVYGLVEINTRLRAEPVLQATFGRRRCAKYLGVQQERIWLTALLSERVAGWSLLNFPNIAYFA